MNLNNYSKWIDEQLKLNLKPNSVVVDNNEGYHNVLVEKAEIQEWIQQHNHCQHI